MQGSLNTGRLMDLMGISSSFYFQAEVKEIWIWSEAVDVIFSGLSRVLLIFVWQAPGLWFVQSVLKVLICAWSLLVSEISGCISDLPLCCSITLGTQKKPTYSMLTGSSAVFKSPTDRPFSLDCPLSAWGISAITAIPKAQGICCYHELKHV